MRDGQGNDSRIYLPDLDDDIMYNAEYVLTSQNELWVFSSNGFPAFGQAGAPAVMRQYQLSGTPVPTAASLMSKRSFGDADSAACSLIKLNSGGLVAAWYRRHEYNGNLDDRYAELFIVYRNSQGSWQEFSSVEVDYLPNALHRVTLGQHPADDSIWLFSKADSFSEIRAMHFTKIGGSLQLDWVDDHFISQDGDGELGPEGELPELIAVSNPYDDTLLLAYQNEYDEIFSTSPFIKWSYITVTTIAADGSKTFTMLEEYAERVHGLNGLIVLPNEVQLFFKPVDTVNLENGDIYFSATDKWKMEYARIFEYTKEFDGNTCLRY